MSTEFKREERYIVFKLSDLGNSLKGNEIRKLAREYAEHLEQLSKKPLDYVVIAADWSEYGPNWKAVEARGAGPLCVPEESDIQTAERSMNLELLRERDALRAALQHETDCVEAAKAETEALRAKIEAMEKQEPVAWLHESRRDSDVVTSAVKQTWQRARPMSLASYSIPLYLAPGAEGEEK